MNECVDPIKRNVETKSRILLEQLNNCLTKEEKVEKIFNALYQCHKEIEKCYAKIADKEALINEIYNCSIGCKDSEIFKHIVQMRLR